MLCAGAAVGTSLGLADVGSTLRSSMPLET
jgi:hypothetical protein